MSFDLQSLVIGCVFLDKEAVALGWCVMLLDSVHHFQARHTRG